MLSGGSALSIIDYVGPTVLGANLSISMLDERVSSDPEAINFLQFQKTDFYKDAFEAEASFFGTVPRTGENMEDLRQRWDNNLKTWRKENPKGLIVATLGMGPDGHTASLFPGDGALKERQRWVVAVIGAKAEANDFLGFLSGTNSVAIWTAAGFTIPR